MLESLLAESSLLAIAKMTMAFAPFIFPPGSALTQYQIARSLRFRGGNSGNLSRTFTSAGDRTKWTYSTWVKKSTSGIAQVLMSGGAAGGDTLWMGIWFDASDVIRIGGGSTFYLVTNRVFRDPSAWMHIVVAADTSQATASNRIRLYVNGLEETSVTRTNPNLNDALGINQAAIHRIGFQSVSVGISTYFDGLQANTHFVNGAQLTPSDFGVIDPVTKVWGPKDYTGTYGTTGFYLDYSDNSAATSSAIGKDRSGNDNDWTPNNFSVSAGINNDSLVDSPTNFGTDTGLGGEVRGNYCTLNPLDNNAVNVISQGNLHYVGHASTQGLTRATFQMADNTGTWTWEYIANANALTGVAKSSATLANYLGADANGWGVFSGDGMMYTNGVINGSVLAAHTTTDVMRYELNTNTGVLTLFKGASSVGSRTIGSGPWYPATGRATGVVDFNFGQRPFSFTPTAGAKALCSQNLPEPAVKCGSQKFNVVSYIGNNAAKSITGAGHQPGIVWVKSRSAAYNNRIVDSVRGVNLVLQTNVTTAELNSTVNDNFGSFDVDGFSFAGPTSSTNGSNENGSSFVSWLWKTGGAAAANTSGSISSSVSVDTVSGVSVISYTGTGANATIGHGLGVAPAFFFGRPRTGTKDWTVWHKSLSAPTTSYLCLDLAISTQTNAGAFNSTAPTSSVLSLGSAANFLNDSGSGHIIYAFAEIPGFSRFGSYTGNGSADGTFVQCDLSPRWLLIKRTDSAGDWFIVDTVRGTYNTIGETLFADLPNAGDSSVAYIDILSNGFKLRHSGSSTNVSSATYIFAAFAEAPFKYARAR